MLPGVAPQVTTLWRMRFLDASHNGLDYWPGDCRALPASQCAWGEAGLQPLLRLRSLADVDVGGCRLALADSSSVLWALEGRGVRGAAEACEHGAGRQFDKGARGAAWWPACQHRAAGAGWFVTRSS